MDGHVEAIAKLLEALAPLARVAFAVFVVWKFKPLIEKLLVSGRMEIEIAGQKLSVAQVTANNGENISDLQARLAKLEAAVAGKSNDVAAPQGETVDFVEGNDNGSVEIVLPFPAPAREAEASSKRILWVDDEPGNNAFLVERFVAEGHIVEISRSTEDALNRLAKARYDRIISDLGRIERGVDRPLAGRDFAAEVRRMKIDTPILIFGAARAYAMRNELIAAGATAVTTSGVDVVKFVDEG
ncbi:response regulator [Oharaeibacter diazotrophicus]|uniref:Response regulator receiver domain-containing protein n=2 Tax=Oharaeibacter diazotrophicus TaxID=1920512 RepID=A0A4R6RBN1_9HYPH|nr:response regulator [Oharaeibacter diazotrophicus]TDP83482.1 response regulator receiver domain-containing protein [Oharaeibacter diazotrophicus]BBE72314.1 regulator of RpoS [Pleomorphomonas sp. SM30]GLS79084.1 response regulator [Oharaeibacter diazotrophicus]